MTNKKNATRSTDDRAVAAVDSGAVSFPIVGIGASAGGLAAFEAFFAGMPADRDTGMAFVLVQHLAPDHKSILSDLIRGYTRMQVFVVTEGMVVQPNCAYIIPPSFDMALQLGALHLVEPLAPRGQRLAIDYFFQSLAEDQQERAIGIVLSGTGSNGTLGVRAIKGVGGMVMAQSTASSEFDGMPRSAIATGLVDYQLPPADMAAQLMAYVAHGMGKLSRTVHSAMPMSESALKEIFVFLRTQTGHDFSQYKPSTICRRIERRITLHQLDSLETYVTFLLQTPTEAQELFRDLLIGVTNFFRDPQAFQVLADEVIPSLFEGKPSGATVRVWSAGCSTGEEAYSLAILLVEQMQLRKQSYTVQVFATDIDARAIAVARAGLYPAGIAADISPERLARYFVQEPDGAGYRIHKSIRDLLVFSEQDLIKDPPFSRLDLISCRNLMIYLDANLQKRLIPLFHYALRPGGTLFLGSSEGIGEYDALFAVLDRKSKLYLRSGEKSAGQPNLGFLLAPLPTDESPARQGRPTKAAYSFKPPLRELMEQELIKRVAPAAALVNAKGDIAYLHGRTGMYLEPSAGEVGVQNILRMARDGLRPGLSTALRTAAATQKSGEALNLMVKTNGHYTQVHVLVHQVGASGAGVPEEPVFLVILQDAPHAAPLAAANGSADVTASDSRARIEALMQELRAKDEYLQNTHEELESSNEELKSSNEEMQSVNEELQSTNEELETSKEELQSVNEELATVNAELQNKVTDLSHVNNDMNNLLAGTGIGTVFVDFKLCILRFTPAISSIIHLIPSDVGRPVAHIVSNLVGYSSLVADIKKVLADLAPLEREVQTPEGQWYTLRIQPYRTLDNVIEGAVISFVDISEIVRVRTALATTRALMERIGELAKVGGWEFEVQSRALYWSPETCRIHEVDPPLAPTQEASIQFYAPQARTAIQTAFQAGMEHGTAWDLELPLQTARGRAIWVRSQGMAVMEAGRVIRLLGAIQDITERKQIEEALREANHRLLAQAQDRN
ncbi:CheR family methyltransferase [Rhodoferax sp. GW822-FHT02A01]|uniref:CheR family methyltransferase n=1 Tax=Rhodoferax sp. GW822-FHT02A01 TaxID=3141537 RepID=UPI00315DF0A7